MTDKRKQRSIKRCSLASKTDKGHYFTIQEIGRSTNKAQHIPDQQTIGSIKQINGWRSTSERTVEEQRITIQRMKVIKPQNNR